MRIAVAGPAPDATLCDKTAWMVDGFREAGHDVRRVHPLEDIGDLDGWADLVILDQKGSGRQHIDLAIAAERRRSTWVCCWRDLISWDPVPLAEQDDLKLFVRLMRAVDVLFMKERDLIPEFAKLDINAAYLDQACPADMQSVEYGERDFDVLVIGRMDYPRRRADVQALVAAGYSVVWAGLPDSAGVPEGVTAHTWVHPTKELPALASRCAVALGVDMVERSGYTSDRTYLLAGLGIPLIARVPEVDTDWGLSALAEIAPQADVASWIYSDHEGLLKCVAQAMAEPGARVARGRQGRERVMERHTYRHRAEQILAAVESLQATTAQ